MVEQIKPGEIGLYSECPPPLSAGLHTCSVRQKVIGEDGASYSMPGMKNQKIKIEGPRFVFTPDDVHSLFPPANDCGNFYNRLPQIVLRRRTLPWERKASEEGEPWLALLLLNENEIDEEGESTPGRVHFYEQFTVDNLLSPSQGNIRSPQLEATSKEREQACMGVDIPASLFYEICPRREELTLLSHVRIVSTEDKELLGQDEDGWFSVVTCNRLPSKNSAVDPGTGQPIDRLKHRAILVSLEGHGGILGLKMRKTTIRPQGVHAQDFIRLAVLASWEFTSKNAGDFQTTLTNIGKSGGVGLLGDNLDNCVTVATSPTERNTVTIETGHIPLTQTYRTGEKGVGLYRGPFTPTPITYDPKICHTADDALVVDPATGLEQIGYGCAFELGRLLGASDETLAVGLLNWRRGNYKTEFEKIDLRDLGNRFRIKVPFDDWENRMGSFAEMFDPLGPLVNPNPDFFLGAKNDALNQMDLCGMSFQYVQNVKQNVMTETGLSEGDFGRDRIGDITSDIRAGDGPSYTFADAVKSNAKMETISRQQMIETIAIDVLSDKITEGR